MVQITSETIKDAVVAAIIEHIPYVDIYEWQGTPFSGVVPVRHELGLRQGGVRKDADSAITFPYIFVEQQSAISREEKANFILSEYLLVVRFYAHENPEDLPRLQQNLDEMARQLEIILPYLEIDGRLHHTTNRHYYKEDGVLFFFFNVTLKERIATPQAPKMRQLDTEIRTKGGEII